MANHSFRAAFWALGLSLGLSVSLLLSDPETARLAILSVPPPQHRPDEFSHPPPTAIADSSQPPSPVDNASAADAALSDPTDHRVALVETSEPPDGASEPWPAAGGLPAETPPLPIREAGPADSTVPPWTLVTAPERRETRGRFEELPPPPEYASIAADVAVPPVAALSRETLEQFSGFGASLDGLRGDLLAVRESQESVERALQELAAATSEPRADVRAPDEIVELRATIVHVTRTGELQDGVLPALARDRGPAAAQVEVAGPDVAWGVCRGGADEVTNWLRGRASLDRMAVRTLRLPPSVSGTLDLWRLLPPRMVQARGTMVFERLPRPMWGTGLEVRWHPDSAAQVALEFRTSGDLDDTGWRRVVVPEGDTFVLTGRLSSAPAAGYGPVGSAVDSRAHEQPVTESEVVVILAPRRAHSESDSAAAPELLTPLPLLP